jgi:hypothetical protein
MEILVTPEEKNFLVEVLRERQRELLREISRSHHHSFRTQLRENEKHLEAVLRKLEAAEAIPA